MKEVAKMIRTHLEGIVAWAQTRQTNGFLEAINGLLQASKRRARGFTRLTTIKSVIFLIAGKLDFHAINPRAGQPTENSSEPYGSISRKTAIRHWLGHRLRAGRTCRIGSGKEQTR